MLAGTAPFTQRLPPKLIVRISGESEAGPVVAPEESPDAAGTFEPAASTEASVCSAISSNISALSSLFVTTTYLVI